ncbi:MAG: hypothetical protein JW913_02865 [Chitinispirillaceae bacterium]|nr:hypothetical protein [Chitinispirillaceae bacterium]
METTPLELYETAYRFHYNENRLADAVAYYKKLLKEFPDSNECGYAVIQLQKIKAHDVAESLQALSASRAPSLHPLVIISFLLALLALIASGYPILFLNKKISAEQKRASLSINALGKIARGENDKALILLAELKKLDTDDITPWELSADIYRKQSKFDEALKEYATFFQRNPGRKPSESELKFMQFKEKPVVNKPAPKPVIRKSSSRSSTPPAPSPAVKKRPLRTRTKLTKPPPPPGPAKQKNGLFLVDPDSISYF